MSGPRIRGDGILVGTAGNTGLNATVTADIQNNTVNNVEDDGLLLKADESATLNARVTGNTLTNSDGLSLAVEGDPFTLRTFFSGNSPGGAWDLEDNAPAGVWQMGANAGDPLLGSTLTTPADTAGLGNDTTGFSVDAGATIDVVDRGTIPAAN